jgi:hypothetical protein
MKCIKVVNGNFERIDGRTTVLTGADALKQRIEHRLKLFKEEWFLSDSIQVNWLKYFRQKFITEPLLRKEIIDVILQDAEVESVQSIQLSLVTNIRRLQVEFEVNSTFGMPIGGSI